MAELLRGARTGEAVYTTLRWGDGPPASWPLHVRRLQAGAAALGMPVPAAEALFAAASHAAVSLAAVSLAPAAHPTVSPPTMLHPTASHAAVSDAALSDATVSHATGSPASPVGEAAELRLRITVLADDPDPVGHLRRPPPGCRVVAEVAGAAPLWQSAPAPVRLWWAAAGRDPRRPLAGHKLAAMADDLAWRQRAVAAGMDDALLGCRLSGSAVVVAEATTAALLLRDATGQWRTPAATAGQVSSTTLQALRDSGLPIDPTDLTWDELVATPWQGMWLLSALQGARPVKQLGGLDVSVSDVSVSDVSVSDVSALEVPLLDIPVLASDLQSRLASWLCAPPRSSR